MKGKRINKKLVAKECVLSKKQRMKDVEKMPAANRQFGASGGVVSWDTSQDFGSSPPVRTLPIPPPVAKLLKRCRQAA